MAADRTPKPKFIGRGGKKVKVQRVPPLPPDVVRIVDPAPSTKPQDRDRVRTGHLMRLLHPKSGLGPVSFVDPHSGHSYSTRYEMREAIRARKRSVIRDFVQLVADKTLGQLAWERLPGETTLQYERFRVYLFMDPKEVITTSDGRRVGQVGRRSTLRTSVKLGVHERTITQLATEMHWKLRADCWDAELERVADDEFRTQKRLAARSQARLGQKLQQVAAKGADNILATGGLDLSAGDVARLADVGVKLERLAMGDSTSNDTRDQTTTLVWAGPAPKWASKGEVVVEQEQVTAGPLGQKVIDATNSSPSDAKLRERIRELTVRKEPPSA